MKDNVLRLCSLTGAQVMYVPWSSHDHLLRAQASWSTEATFPGALTGRVDTEEVRVNNMCVARNVLRAEPRHVLVDVMTANFPGRSVAVEAECHGAVERALRDLDREIPAGDDMQSYSVVPDMDVIEGDEGRHPTRRVGRRHPATTEGPPAAARKARSERGARDERQEQGGPPGRSVERHDRLVGIPDD